jgi:hypothetical protein
MAKKSKKSKTKKLKSKPQLKKKPKAKPKTTVPVPPQPSASTAPFATKARPPFPFRHSQATSLSPDSITAYHTNPRGTPLPRLRIHSLI